MEDEQKKEMHQVSGRLPLAGDASVLGHPRSSLNNFLLTIAPDLEISPVEPNYSRRHSTGRGHVPWPSRVPAESKEYTAPRKVHSESERSEAWRRIVTEVGERQSLWLRENDDGPHEAGSDGHVERDHVMAMTETATRQGGHVDERGEHQTRGAFHQVAAGASRARSQSTSGFPLHARWTASGALEASSAETRSILSWISSTRVNDGGSPRSRPVSGPPDALHGVSNPTSAQHEEPGMAIDEDALREADKQLRRRALQDQHDLYTLEGFSRTLSIYGQLNVAYEFVRREREIEHLKGLVQVLKWHTEKSAEVRGLDLDLPARETVVSDLEDQLATRAVITGLERLSSQVEDIAIDVAEVLFDGYEDPPLSEANLLAIVEAVGGASSPDEATLLVLRLAIHVKEKQMRVSDYVLHAMSTTLAFGVQRAVFDRLQPALDPAEDRVLQKVYDQVRWTEPQPRSAHWRSITCSRTCPSGPTLSTLAARLTSDLLAMFLVFLTPLNLGPLSPFNSCDPLDLSTHAPELMELVLAALQWHAKSKSDYLSVDYIASVDFSAQEGDIVAVQGFGLKQRRGVVGQEGKVESREEVLVKVPVVLRENLQ